MNDKQSWYKGSKGIKSSESLRQQLTASIMKRQPKKHIITKSKTTNRFPNCPIASNNYQFSKDQQLIEKANSSFAKNQQQREARQIEFLRQVRRKQIVANIVAELRSG